MSAAVTFVPEEMDGFAAESDGWALALREEARDLDAALDRFRTSSSEYVPAIPDHARRIDGLAERMSSLAEAVGTLAAAAEQADREGVRLHDLLLTVSGGIANADKAAGASEALVNLARTLVYASRVAFSWSRLTFHNLRWGSGRLPDIRRVRDRMPGGPNQPRPQARAFQIALYRKLKGPRAAAQRAYYNALQGLRHRVPITGVGERVRHFLRTTPAGRTLQWTGRKLGWTGVGLGAYDAVRAGFEGDVERSVTSGLSAFGGALMMTGTPVTIAVGAALVVGTLIYENREAIGNAVDSVVEGAGRILGDLF